MKGSFMKLPILLTACSAIVMLNGCSSNPSSTLVTNDSATETTGYWYLGDNGQRQWRTFTSDGDNKDSTFKEDNRNGISPFGNGSGR